MADEAQAGERGAGGSDPRTSPLTPLQLRLRARCLADQAGTFYNVCLGVRFHEPVRAPAMAEAWRLLTGRHEALRAAFPLRDGAPVQVFVPSAPAAEVVALEAPAADLGREIQETAEQLWHRPVDLLRGPVARAALLTTSADQAAALVLSVHHIVCDRWTLRLLTHDLMALYRSVLTGEPAGLAPLPVSYPDNCAWEADVYATARASNLTYWKAALAGAPPVSALPAAAAPVGPSGGTGEPPRVGRHTFRIDPSTAGKLKAVARRLRVTPFMLYAAVHGCVLGRFADQDDVVFGTQVSGRLRPESEQIAGFFVNTLPLRMRAGGDLTFAEAVAGVGSAVMDVVEHQVIALEDIVAQSGVSRLDGRHPVFQTVFQFLGAPAWGAGLDGLEILSAPIEDAQFEMSVNCGLEPGGAVQGQICHSPVIDAAVAASFADRFTAACEQIAASEGRLTVGAIGAVEAERPTAGVPGTGPEPEPVRAPVASPGPGNRETGRLLVDGWTSWDQVALDGGGGTATYQDLRAHTDRATALLDARGPRDREEVVGIYGQVTAPLIGAVAATLLRGGGFAGIDPGWPGGWVRQILDTGGISTVLTDGTPLPPELRDWTGRVLDLAEDVSVEGPPAGDVSAEDAPVPGGGVPAAGGSRTPYICFTSGTTGAPKGVLSTATGLGGILARARAVPLSRAPRVLHSGLLTTEPRIRELLGALAAGGRVVVPDRECWQDPRQLCARIAEEGITHLDAVTPSLLDALLRAHAKSREAMAVTEVHTFGEALPSEVAREAAERWGCEVYAHYGVSEFAMSATSWHFAPAAAALGGLDLPVGDAGPGVRMYLVDSAGRQAPVGGRGEIAIGGAGLALGYVGTPGGTARRFVPDPWGPPGSRMFLTGDLAVRSAEGWARFLGRKDRQVNLRGFRVEPEGIEAGLRAGPGVRDAAVAVKRLPSGNRLVAAVVTDGSDLAAARVRAHLAHAVPKHLGEATLVFVPAIPITATGKTDLDGVLRLGEGADAAGGADQGGPAGALEAAVTGIWETVLARQNIGRRESFFDLGGHSLNAFEVAAAIEERTGLACPVQLVMSNPTVESLAAALASLGREHGAADSPEETTGNQEGGDQR